MRMALRYSFGMIKQADMIEQAIAAALAKIDPKLRRHRCYGSRLARCCASLGRDDT